MAEDPSLRQYMEHIKNHPKFQPTGEIDECGFYYQPDGSFFDPEGYFFNAQGYDELGGYYDDNGNYCEDDMGAGGFDHEDPAIAELGNMAVLNSIDNASEKTEFHAILTNLPFKSRKKDVGEELAKLLIVTVDIIEKIESNKLMQIEVVIKDKASAKNLYNLSGKKFLGRDLNVEFVPIDEADTEVFIYILIGFSWITSSSKV